MILFCAGMIGRGLKIGMLLNITQRLSMFVDVIAVNHTRQKSGVRLG
jgi:hypothetical protein